MRSRGTKAKPERPVRHERTGGRRESSAAPRRGSFRRVAVFVPLSDLDSPRPSR
jgi:hypothetical protein